MRLSIVLTIALAHGTLIAQVPRPDDRAELQKLREEMWLAEEKLEILRRVTPPEFDRIEEEKALRKLAAKAKVSNLKIRFVEETMRLPLEDGTPSPVELHRTELSGNDHFQNIYLFLSMLDRRPGYTRLETLRIDAADGGDVRFSARIAVPVLTHDPQTESSIRDGLLAATRRALAGKRAIVSTLSQYLDPARKEQVPDALAMLETEIGTRPIALIGTGFDGTNVTLRGVLVGVAARGALKNALQKASLRTIREEFSRTGICQAFTITARPDPADRLPAAAIGNGMFDAATAAVCKPQLADAAGPIVAGASSADAPPPFLQLRDVDLVDLFSALGDLLPEAFVVDDDVTGRVRVDVFDNASLDDVFRATATTTGVRIGSGPVRHVSRATRSEVTTTRTSDAGSPVSFTIKEAAISDLLCIFGQVTETEIRVPPDLKGRLSIFAIETPVNHLLDTVIDAAGLSSVTEKGRLVLRKRDDAGDIAAVNVCEMRQPAVSSRLDAFPMTLPELGMADIELVGLARFSQSWRGYVYGPARRLMQLEAGYELFDATVKSVGPGGAIFTRKDGKVVTMALRK